MQVGVECVAQNKTIFSIKIRHWVGNSLDCVREATADLAELCTWSERPSFIADDQFLQATIISLPDRNPAQIPLSSRVADTACLHMAALQCSSAVKREIGISFNQSL